MDANSKPQKPDEISNGQKTSIVWLDNSNDTSDANISGQQQLRTLDPDLKLFNDDNQCETYLKSQCPHSRIILIVNGGLGQKIVPRIQDFGQIIAIYVYCWNKALHEEWAKKHTKVCVLFERLIKSH
jgi:hypothetical protein